MRLPDYGALVRALLVAMAGLPAQAAPAPVHAAHNPILSDGQYYSADPAPLVVGDTLYILAGRDEAPPQVNDFTMNEWQLLATKNVASGDWLHTPHFLKPELVFTWAATGHAYAGQIVQGPDKRFYFYAPVMRANCTDDDCMAIGVAVADSVGGPWRDAHPSGPIVSQSVPQKNDMQNIDPTPIVDDDGRVYLYWGTFGELRAMELAADMVTPRSGEITITNLKGFFEAPWLFKRHGTYYLAYADNDTDPAVGCTAAIYHACIGYASAPGPLGPWTYRGVILPPLSSTTSHPGIVEFQGKWYIAYHTADAKGGGHFRRSVAIDELQWDDAVSPAAIRPITPTPRPVIVTRFQRNIAALATPSASNQPIPVRYWLKSLSDGVVAPNPLPPDVWGTWNGKAAPAASWIAYHWPKPVTINAARLWFWADDPSHKTAINARLPKSWHLEVCRGARWIPVKLRSGPSGNPASAGFSPITTRCLRAVFTAAEEDGNPVGVAVREWEVSAVRPVKVTRRVRAQ